MERFEFEGLLRQALSQIPKRYLGRLENVEIIVEDWPTQDQLAGHNLDDGETLLGLYEGVPLTERADYMAILPDRITIFQRSIESVCHSSDEIVEEVRATLIHEIAHHFGIDDDRLHEMGR